MKHTLYKIMAAAILLTLAALYADAAPASEAESRTGIRCGCRRKLLPAAIFISYIVIIPNCASE